MSRVRIKVGLLLIAAGSAVYWLQPPAGPVWIAGACTLWALLTLASFHWDRAEDWTYRLSSFLAVALGTMEGVSGLLGASSRPWILVLAFLHFVAFVLAVTGRYQKVSSKRERLL